MITVRDRSKARIDVRNEVFRHDLVKRLKHAAEVWPNGRAGWLPSIGARGSQRFPRLARVSPFHHDKHGTRLPLRDQVVHDEGYVPLIRPPTLVLAGPVL